jgi:ATP-dependent Clp protease ATP-binding subunit ClpC
MDPQSYSIGLLGLIATLGFAFWHLQRVSSPNGTWRPRKFGTPILEQYSIDLTAMAKRGELDPVIGRDQEVHRVIQILSRRTKNNPVLIGPSGIGKTAVVEALAQRIVAKEVPSVIQNKRVLSLDLGSLVAGTKYRGEFEKRLKGLTDEIIRSNRSVILFIDELHTLAEAGEATGAIDAANILKPPLARGLLQAVGATTQKEYQAYIENDLTLERRFQPIHILEPSVNETINILKGIRQKYEQHHGVQITDEAIRAAVTLSGRCLRDRYYPDKAIDLMDEACAKVQLDHLDMLRGSNKKPVVRKKDIIAIVQEWKDNLVCYVPRKNHHRSPIRESS